MAVWQARAKLAESFGCYIKNCPTHGERTLLPESMWDRTETLQFEPPQLTVRVTVYQKFACEGQPQCGVASPERPTGIIEGDKHDTSIAAEIITGKFGYHLPIYRQEDYFAGSGWTPGRSTLLNILTNSHFVIEPLLDFFKRTVQRDSIVGCDDTSVTLLYPKTIHRRQCIMNPEDTAARLRKLERVPCQVFDRAKEASQAVADEIVSLIRQRAKVGKHCVLGLATGSTPTTVYERLVEMHRHDGLSFKNVSIRPRTLGEIVRAASNALSKITIDDIQAVFLHYGYERT